MHTIGDQDEAMPTAKHPYLTRNFTPVQTTIPLTSCEYVGTIPVEFHGGQYVCNGSNPVTNSDQSRDAHWFDGDGMLCGVLFSIDEETGKVVPQFVNQFVLTDLYLSAINSPNLRVPIVPSITILINPLTSLLKIAMSVMRTVALVILSFLPGSKQKIKRVSVANTNIVFHDRRALALCESGPPMRVHLPGLETVGWFNGHRAEGEGEGVPSDSAVLGGKGPLSFFWEWTTAHPKIDPTTDEMLLFHNSFLPPYVKVSVLPARGKNRRGDLLNRPVPGMIRRGKVMHDFGVSRTHTVIMDLPLTLDPMNLLKGLPTVHFDETMPSRFGVFPRHRPEDVTWLETAQPCCIFHTANTWDETDNNIVNLLACRMTSPCIVYILGNLPVPSSFSPFTKREKALGLEETPLVPENESLSPGSYNWDMAQCRLYFYSFNLSTKQIAHEFALSRIPFEFPSVSPAYNMQSARYVYGCSTTSPSGSFTTTSPDKVMKIDVLVKMDVAALIQKGKQEGHPSGCVDLRLPNDVFGSNDANDFIKSFKMPEGWIAQEPRFVPRKEGEREDSGYLVFFAFNEGKIFHDGGVPDGGATSELWILDARSMEGVVARVRLPLRVPFGLHGIWFSAREVGGQREVERFRDVKGVSGKREGGVWMGIRGWIERRLG
ncbi:retinal pigment epithelial membrane protein [Piedraia hortae CBS 480.64]|uniref:Retinal pigment epithelial membrane protein n=1 Tax=Piedraia hortae CBS 480.64 TaxID=1314780 RepID=A0A6A7BZ85_9PEZI|nr:retinal pigment epithelial membrane protein [Piedraia hortae CBS 480.64]